MIRARNSICVCAHKRIGTFPLGWSGVEGSNGPSMKPMEPLTDVLSTQRRHINVVLFSQPGCAFCAEERQHYLQPLAREARKELTVLEVELDAAKQMRDWHGQLVTQGDFARASGARFAPTVMFFDASGRPVAEPIVGLSRDFFGVYLEQRIATALRAVA